MNNFDLKKYLAEGRLFEESNPIWVIDAFEDSADISDAGPAYKKAVMDIIKSKHPDISDKDLEASIEVMNVTWYNEARSNAKGSEPEEMKVSAEDFADGAIEHYEDIIVFDNNQLKEDVSSRFIKKYLSSPPPKGFKSNDDYFREDQGIEDIESYSDRDKAILIYLETGPGIIVNDKVAKGIKGKSGADIVKYFQDEDYTYMPYGEMRQVLGVPAISGFTFDESGSQAAENWYLKSQYTRQLNKIWRAKYPELDLPKFNKDNFKIKFDTTVALTDYYRGIAREQKGEDLEVTYEEFAEDYVQFLKDADKI